MACTYLVARGRRQPAGHERGVEPFEHVFGDRDHRQVAQLPAIRHRKRAQPRQHGPVIRPRCFLGGLQPFEVVLGSGGQCLRVVCAEDLVEEKQ